MVVVAVQPPVCRKPCPIWWEKKDPIFGANWTPHIVSRPIAFHLYWDVSRPSLSCIRTAVWPDLAIYWTLGNFLKPLATINLPQSPQFLGNFCKSVKIIHFSSETIFGNFYRHLAIFIWSHWSCFPAAKIFFILILLSLGKCAGSRFERKERKIVSFPEIAMVKQSRRTDVC